MVSLPPCGHRIAGIDRQVHDDLLDLAGIGLDRAKVRARDHDQIDVFADQAGEHLQVFRDDAVQVEHLGCEHLLAAEGQQLAGERGGALGGIGDLLRVAAQRRNRCRVRSSRNSQ